MRSTGLVLLAALLSGCTTVHADREPVQVHMSNVDLHVTRDITLHVTHLTGHFRPVGRDVPHLDYKQSYAVAIDAGEIGLDVASLNALMTYSTEGKKSNIDRLRVTITGDGTLRQKGVVDGAVNVPFDFSVDDWNAQLVAGYSRTLQNRSLKAFMPDYNDLSKSPKVVAKR